MSQTGSTGRESAASGSDSPSDRPTRGRGGFRYTELNTIPANVTQLSASDKQKGAPVHVYANFVKIEPMKEQHLWAYRVDFEPDVENVRLRRCLFKVATTGIFREAVTYDGYSDARAAFKLPDPGILEKIVEPPPHYGQMSKHTITVKLVGQVTWDSPEMLRVYNLNTRDALRILGFFQVERGKSIHPQLTTNVGSGGNLITVRGYQTGVSAHDGDQLLMKLEPVHKLMQRQNVFETITEVAEPVRQSRGNVQEAVREALTGALIVALHNKKVYKVESINFRMNPMSTFLVRSSDTDISYREYFQTKYNLSIRHLDQPMLLVVDNSRRRDELAQDTDCYMIPELCNIAGLTEKQRNDRYLKRDLIQSSQIPPADRVRHMETFLEQFHGNESVVRMLKNWSYSVAREPVRMSGFSLGLEAIGTGKSKGTNPDNWPKAQADGGFESLMTRDGHLAESPTINRMVVIISRPDLANENAILKTLKGGFDKIKFKVEGAPMTIRIADGESPHLFRQRLAQVPREAQAAIVVLPNGNKDRYDAIKKVASCEMGLVTQAVTSRLLLDPKKAGGAAVKIGIQLAAKCGGEPWYVNMPIAGDMVCGYDTYHDTAQRGRSFGAFVASTNEKFSRWFSRADCHDHIDELSSHLAANLDAALSKFQEGNGGKLPRRVLIYRDGVSDGQLAHVFETELKRVKEVVRAASREIKLTFTIVTKRVGARFYMKQGNSFANPPPGSVFDTTVTRRERYDFYLVSQSTRNGTVTPTYYNIISDESGLDIHKHQILAFKLCFLYYNWTGTVRVPAPCQYAHKLAILCGENLHQVPHSSLDDRLHFL